MSGERATDDATDRSGWLRDLDATEVLALSAFVPALAILVIYTLVAGTSAHVLLAATVLAG